MTEQRAYYKFKTRIEQTSIDKILWTIENYYILADDPNYNNIKDHLNGRSLDELKELCLELCGEAINRDMINYFVSGTRGNIGPQLYKMLL